MDLSTVTIADFKALFYRDFPYLPNYDNAALYNTGDVVYYPTTKLFYKAKVNGVTGILPTDNTKWEETPQSIDNYIQDQDITRAFSEAQISLNQTLFSSDPNIKLGYLYMTSHYLVNDIRASMAGIAGSAAFIMTSRSVGSVSESYGIPSSFMDNPLYSFFSTSAYGLKYLSMVLTRMVGNVVAVCGTTRP